MSREELTQSMVDRIIAWSDINTGTLNIPGLLRLGTELTHAFGELGCAGEVILTSPIEQYDDHGSLKETDFSPILHFWKRPDAEIKVLLIGHMDTVFDLKHPFQKAHQQDNNILIGPGVTDMKGGLCVMLEALRAFEFSDDQDKEKLGWEVIINGDEEMGSLASSAFIEERANYNHVGLVFEPSMDDHGTLAGKRKGSGKFTILVHGIAAHAGKEFYIGRNAIVHLAQIITEINQLNNQKKDLTISVGKIRGGGAINIVPDFAYCKLDIRIPDNEDGNWVKEQLNQIIEKAHNTAGFSAVLQGDFHRPPKKIDDQTKKLYDLVQQISAEMDHPIAIKPSGGCTDGNNLSKMGLPNVDSLGVCGGKIHTSGEYLLIDSLYYRTELATRLLVELAKGLSGIIGE